EQIFVDDYTTRHTTGSLQIWFPLNTSQSEQLRFLREVEDRAIEAAVRKMQASVDNPEAPPPNFSPTPPPNFSQTQSQSQSQSQTQAQASPPDEASPGQTAADQAQLLAQLLQRRHEDIQKWREDARVEARKGSNWSHDWATRTHLYKPGPALDALVRSPNGNSSGNL
ncbi:MAG: hypothetical protein ACREFH_09125, partial [Stellaceae bacterium]